jgi:hypothetical protein
MAAIHLAPVDWIIVVLYFVFIIGIGLYLKRHGDKEEDFFLAGDSKGTVSVLKTTGSTIEKVSELSDLHAARLRGIARVASTSTEAAFAASVCAGGRIVFSKLDLASGTLEEVRSVETGMRVTCFTSNC